MKVIEKIQFSSREELAGLLLSLCLTINLSLQACYLSKISPKETEELLSKTIYEFLDEDFSGGKYEEQ